MKKQTKRSAPITKTGSEKATYTIIKPSFLGNDVTIDRYKNATYMIHNALRKCSEKRGLGEKKIRQSICRKTAAKEKGRDIAWPVTARKNHRLQ